MTEDTTVIKPKSLQLAVKLIWLSFGISFIQSLLLFYPALKMATNLDGGILITFIVSSIIGTAFFIFLVCKINSGKNWARIIYLVFYILSVVSLIRGIMVGVPYTMFLVMSALTIHMLSIYSLYLLFFSSAKFWFKPSIKS